MGFKASYAADAIVYHKGSAATSKLSDFAVYQTYRNLLWTQIKNFPLALLLWQSPWLALGFLVIFIHYITKGRPLIILRAIIAGELGMLPILKKRRLIQKRRTATNKQILSWFETGLFPKNLLRK